MARGKVRIKGGVSRRTRSVRTPSLRTAVRSLGSRGLSYVADNPEVFGQISSVVRAARTATPYVRAAISGVKRLRNGRSLARAIGSVSHRSHGPASAKRTLRTGGGKIVPLKGRFTRNRLGKYALRGARARTEKFGSVSGDNIAYLGISANSLSRAADGNMGANPKFHVALALLRYIWKKEFGIDVTDPAARWPAMMQYESTTAAPHQIGMPRAIKFYYRFTDYTGLTNPIGFIGTDVAGVQFNVLGTGTSAGDESFQGLAARLVEDVFDSSLFGGAQNSNGQYYRLLGYSMMGHQGDASGVETYTNAMRRLDNLVVKGYSVATVKIQNTTLADSNIGDQRDTSRIDANPLKCRMYYFKNHVPYLKEFNGTNVNLPGNQDGTFTTAAATNEWKLQLDRNRDGIICWGDGSPISTGGGWSQFPDADRFWNCTGYKDFTLDPGEVKHFSVKRKFDMLLSDFIVKHAHAGSYYYFGHQRVPGRHVLLCAETYMSTASNDASLNYEVQFYGGAMIKKSIPQVMASYVAGPSLVNNDNPPV